jgi:hypothetical protein
MRANIHSPLQINKALHCAASFQTGVAQGGKYRRKKRKSPIFAKAKMGLF